MAKYELYLTDDAGRRITLLRNIAFMSMSKTMKGYGTFHVGIPFQDFKVRPAFLPDRRVEVWRSPSHGATMRREGSFFLRKVNVYVRQEDSVEIVEFYGRSPLDILRRQCVTSTTLANYTKTNEIDDMMREIVSENFISPVQTVPSGELTVSGTQGLGPIVSHSFFSQNVLDVLKDLRDISLSLNDADSTSRRIFFDVVEDVPLSNGGFGYSFRTYADLRGTDRTKGTIFSAENGNMEAPSYYEDHLDSSTHAKVLNLSTPAANGDSESPDSGLSRWNDIVAAQQSSDTDADVNLSRANQILQDEKADVALNVTFLDSPGSNRQPRSLYGVDWDLGDLLPVRYADKDFNVEVEIVYLSVDEEGKENIVGMSSPRIIAPTPPVAIDIGSGATNRATSQGVAGGPFTFIDLANPANASGSLTTIELWFNTSATGVKVGTFSGSAPNFTSRDVATIGSVTSGSKQTFTGLNIQVVAGDFIGIYWATGAIEYDSSGGTDAYFKVGDQFGAGAQVYTQAAGDAFSVYGIGA